MKETENLQFTHFLSLLVHHFSDVLARYCSFCWHIGSMRCAIPSSFQADGRSFRGLVWALLALFQAGAVQAQDEVNREVNHPAKSQARVSFNTVPVAIKTSPVAQAQLDLRTPGVLARTAPQSPVARPEAGDESTVRVADITTSFPIRSSAIRRYQLDSGTRVTGWQLRDDVFFGRSKGDLSGVALIWQRSQTDQLSLSGSGLKLTRRIN